MKTTNRFIIYEEGKPYFIDLPKEISDSEVLLNIEEQCYKNYFIKVATNG